MRIDRAADDEVGLGRHGQASVGRDHGDAPAAQGAGERQLGQPLGQRHDRGDRQGGRAADEHVDPQRFTPADRRRMVHADPAMDLVVQPDLAVGLVLVARELDPVHPQVRSSQAGPVGVLGVDLRQRDERPAVHRPALDLRQLVDRDSVGQDRPGPHAPGQQPPERARHAAISPGVLGQRARIDLELDQPAHRLERVAKQELRPVERAEQVAQRAETPSPWPGETRGPARPPDRPAAGWRRPPGEGQPPGR